MLKRSLWAMLGAGAANAPWPSGRRRDAACVLGTACGHHPGTAPSAFTTSFAPSFPRDRLLPPSSVGTKLGVRGPLQPDALGRQLTILATFNLTGPSGCLPGAAGKPNSPHGLGEPSVLLIFAAGSC